MTDVQTEAILDLRVTDATSASDRSDKSHMSRRAATRSPLAGDNSGVVSVAYTVTAQSTISAAQLASELAASVTSGAFNTNLQQAVESESSATDLQGCTSDTVSTTVVAPFVNSNDDDSRSLDGGGVFGVVVGVLAIAAIFIGAVYVIVAKKAF